MNKFLPVGRIIAAVTCFSGATYLASLQVDGWGWLIFAGILSIQKFEIEFEGDDEKNHK